MPSPIYHDLLPGSFESLNTPGDVFPLEKAQEYLDTFSLGETPRTDTSYHKIRLAIPARLDDLEARDMTQNGINDDLQPAFEPGPAQLLLSRPRRSVRSLYSRPRIITVTKTVKIPILHQESACSETAARVDSRISEKKKPLPFSINTLLRKRRSPKKAAKKVSRHQELNIFTAGFELVNIPIKEIFETASYEELKEVRTRYLKSRLNSLKKNDIRMKEKDRHEFLTACKSFHLVS